MLNRSHRRFGTAGGADPRSADGPWPAFLRWFTKVDGGVGRRPGGLPHWLAAAAARATFGARKARVTKRSHHYLQLSENTVRKWPATNPFAEAICGAAGVSCIILINSMRAGRSGGP